MRRLYAFFFPLALVPWLGATDCEFFDTVTVPESDANPPILGTRLFIDGAESMAAWEMHETVSDPDAFIVAFPFVYDPGGAKNLNLSEVVEVRCKLVTGEPSPGFDAHLAPSADSQSGTVGSKVSNGIYLMGHTFQPSEWGKSCEGKTTTVDRVVYTWAISGEDFGGNSASMLGGQITYVQ